MESEESLNEEINVVEIMRGTTVDGPGFRTSIYVAGCRHHCPGCHNPGTWDFNAGRSMTFAEILSIVEEEDFNVTISGGDPFYQPEKIGRLVDEINLRGYKVWLYTGFSWEEILADAQLKALALKAEAIVEGAFIAELRDESIPFRGSSNQRIIRINELPDFS